MAELGRRRHADWTRDVLNGLGLKLAPKMAGKTERLCCLTDLCYLCYFVLLLGSRLLLSPKLNAGYCCRSWQCYLLKVADYSLHWMSIPKSDFRDHFSTDFDFLWTYLHGLNDIFVTGF
jgi:hypothetical protein